MKVRLKQTTVSRAVEEKYDGSESLPEIRRQRVFQACSVPGTDRLQKLLSVGPEGYSLSKNRSKSNDNP